MVTSTSPLMLDAVDEVAFLAAGGSSPPARTRELLDRDPAYRRVVTREVDLELTSESEALR